MTEVSRIGKENGSRSILIENKFINTVMYNYSGSRNILRMKLSQVTVVRGEGANCPGTIIIRGNCPGAIILSGNCPGEIVQEEWSCHH